MKKLALFPVLALFTVSAFAETITGDAQCAKCELGTADKCQMAIVVTGADGKKETILADQNDVSKGFHKTICKETKKVTAEGKVSEKDGKKTIALTKVEEAK